MRSNPNSASSASSGLSSVSRIVFLLTWATFRVPFPQTEIKCDAVARAGFSPYPTAVAVDRTLNRGPTDTDTGKIRAFVQSGKRCKWPVGVRHVKAGTIVRNKVNGFSLLLLLTKGDSRGVGLAGVLPGVIQ